MQGFCDFQEKKLTELFAEWGEPRYRVDQVWEWVYHRGVFDPEQMTNLPKPLREKLATVAGPQLELVRQNESDDEETTKYLWRLQDKLLVESVLIRAPNRRTVCVSSQVGCPARCAFCASGKKGFFRNLTTGEIVEQVLRVHSEQPISHIVFMGMGEPFCNLDAVLEAIGCLTQRLGISQRRITVSTVGVIEGIEALIASDLKINLVLSLHAPNQRLRQKLVPYARQYPLDELLQAMENYAARSGRDVTYEYTLMAGVNDQPAHAKELVALLREKQCTVNLIPYNPVVGLRLKRPQRAAIEAFRAVLDEGRLVNTCRYTKGDDIAAACGQLALQEG